MQKRRKKKWRLSGIECRVADSQSQITNISRGGYALGLDRALRLAFGGEKDISRLKKKLYQYCLAICKTLDRTKEHYSEFGIDIGIDTDKNLWLFEANVLPSFKGFKKLSYETYLDIRYSPLIYALSLTKFAPKKKRDPYVL